MPRSISRVRRRRQTSRITSRGSSSVTPLTTGTPRLTMPAFSPAIAAKVSPNCRW